MKDTKSLTLLLLSSVLFLLSIILLCTWGYQYYHQIQDDKTKTSQAVKSESAVNDATRDSLLKIYKVTLNSLDNKADTAYNMADSLKGQLNVNLQDFYRLRDEIATLLQSQTPRVEDLNLARKKITELQQRVELLRYRNSDVENENKRLKAVIDQLSKTSATPGALSTNSGNESPVDVENKPEAVPVSNASPGTISAVNLNLAALAGNTDTETNEAGAAEKLVGTFTVKNNSGTNALCEIIVMVTQPDGQVLQKSAWESGTFQTRNGRRIYSCKIRCETGVGESKQINFSLSAGSYQKGSYIMRIYHNGVMIGKLQKTLS